LNTRTEKTAEFLAKGDDGKLYEVIEYTLMTEHKPVAGAPRWLSGSKKYELKDSSPVNPSGDDKFAILKTGVLLHKSDA
jgi:hypothetical protein